MEDSFLIIEESVDSTYFLVRVGGNTIPNATGYTLLLSDTTIDTTQVPPVPVTNVYAYEFVAEDNINIGVKIRASGLGMPNGVFSDGVKFFRLYSKSSPNPSVDEPILETGEGFAATVAGKVMKDAANYRLEMEYKMKEQIWDRVILLTNLSYSATIGDVTRFENNLLVLQRIL